MKRIDNFMLPEQFNELYSKEAISSIVLTKEMAEKINELVDNFNKFGSDDTTWKLEQESNIRQAVVYMKDNLLNSLNDLLVLFRDSGFIDDRIHYHCSNIIDRVNNLLGVVKQGTTTMDSEIIDARTDIDGSTWATFGEYLRSISKLVRELMDEAYFITEKVDTPIINGWLDRAGVYQSNASTGDIHKCLKFGVTAGESYLIYSEYGWNMPDCVALDSNNSVVKIYNTSDSRQVNDSAKVITIPDKARYLVVNCMYPANKPVSARRIVKCDNKAVIDYINNAILSVKGTKAILTDNLITSVETGKAIRACEPFSVDNQGFVIGSCSVKAGNRYLITAGGNFECNYYVWSDKNGMPVDYAPKTPANEYKTNTFEVTAPIGAVTITVGNFNGVTPVVKQIKGYTNDVNYIWENINWCCVGDSLTEVNSRTNKRYYEYIQDKTGINVVNMGVGGTGYKRGEDTQNAFYQRVSAMPNNIDVVTIFGSGNDNTYFNNIGTPTDTNTNTLCGCINKTIDNLYSVNPLVKIGIISPTPWINHQPTDNTKFKDYAEALKTICELRGIPYLDLYHLSQFRPNEEAYRALVFSKDDGNGVHPNEEGHKIISSHIYNFLNSLIGTY